MMPAMIGQERLVPPMRYNARLPGRLGKDAAHTAAAAVEPGAGRGREPGVAAEAGPQVGRIDAGVRPDAAARAPAGLPEVAVSRSDADAGAAHRRDPRAGGGPIGLRDAEGVALVAAVSRGEVDADSLDGRLHQRVLEGLHEAARQKLAGEAVRVG